MLKLWKFKCSSKTQNQRGGTNPPSRKRTPDSLPPRSMRSSHDWSASGVLGHSALRPAPCGPRCPAKQSGQFRAAAWDPNCLEQTENGEHARYTLTTIVYWKFSFLRWSNIARSCLALILSHCQCGELVLSWWKETCNICGGSTHKESANTKPYCIHWWPNGWKVEKQRLH